MNPWKVIGYELWKNDTGEDCVRLSVVRPLTLAEGHTGDGFEVQRMYFKSKYVNYTPVIGHLIAPVEGRYGISEIYVVGQDKS